MHRKVFSFCVLVSISLKSTTEYHVLIALLVFMAVVTNT